MIGDTSADVFLTVTRASDYDALPTLKYEYGEYPFTFDFPGLDPVGTPGGPHDLGPAVGGAAEYLYIWAEYVDEPLLASCYGLQLQADDAGSLVLDESLMYRHKLLVKGPQFHIRWENTEPITLHDGADGIGATEWDLGGMCPAAHGDPDHGRYAVDLGDYEWDTTGRLKSLVGGIAVHSDGSDQLGELFLGLGTYGLLMHDGTGFDAAYLPNVWIGDQKVQDYSTDLGDTPTQTMYERVAYYTPEPATLLLIAVVGCIRRQR